MRNSIAQGLFGAIIQLQPLPWDDSSRDPWEPWGAYGMSHGTRRKPAGTIGSSQLLTRCPCEGPRDSTACQSCQLLTRCPREGPRDSTACQVRGNTWEVQIITRCPTGRPRTSHEMSWHGMPSPRDTWELQIIHAVSHRETHDIPRDVVACRGGSLGNAREDCPGSHGNSRRTCRGIPYGFPRHVPRDVCLPVNRDTDLLHHPLPSPRRVSPCIPKNSKGFSRVMIRPAGRVRGFQRVTD